MSVILYGWGSMFGLPTPSPFVTKTDIQLQLLGLTFERAIADLEAVSKHKAPYVRDGEQLVEDSTFIRWHFEKKLAKDLDATLSDKERAQAWMVERALEHRLVPLMVCERWTEEENFQKGPRQFFMRAPEAIREQVIQKVRGDLATTLHGSGFTRFTREERTQLAAADFEACARLLGDNEYLFGKSPAGADATFYGVLSACATRFFDGPMPDLIDRHANLSAYLKRMTAQFFAVDRWPKMG